MRDIELCEFAQCPLKDKCVRFMEDLDKTEFRHIATYPYKEDKKKCGYFISSDSIRIDQRIIDNILERIKQSKDGSQNK
jgi:hypothetical protein